MPKLRQAILLGHTMFRYTMFVTQSSIHNLGSTISDPRSSGGSLCVPKPTTDTRLSWRQGGVDSWVGVPDTAGHALLLKKVCRRAPALPVNPALEGRLSRESHRRSLPWP